MQFLPGFKWAVPTAFSDAVQLCRFEEGDVLYDTPVAYRGEWDTASQEIEYSLQVRFPPRVTVSADQARTGVMARSWNSTVRLHLFNRLQPVHENQLETTQGRLYTTLWKGDVRALNNDGPTPSLPIGAKTVLRQLSDVTDAATNRSKGLCVFATVHDVSNPVLRRKYAKIQSTLQDHLSEEPCLLRPKAAGLKDWEQIAPTIDIAFFRVHGLSAGQLHDAVKSAVYVPGEHAVTDKFNIAAHGAIF